MKNKKEICLVILLTVILVIGFDLNIALCEDTIVEETKKDEVENPLTKNNSKYWYLAGVVILGAIVLGLIYYFFSGEGPSAEEEEMTKRKNVIKELKKVSVMLLPRLGIDVSELYPLTMDMPKSEFIRHIHLHYNFQEYIESLYSANPSAMAEFERITRCILDIKQNIRPLPETVTLEEFDRMVWERNEMIVTLNTCIEQIISSNEQFARKQFFF